VSVTRFTPLIIFWFPGAASAHGFAQRYDLPVPLSLYIGGAAATVALSFVVIAWFMRSHDARADYPRFDLLRTHLGRVFGSRYLAGTIRLLASCTLVLVIVAGFIGDQNPFQNIAPTLVWVIWWVGFAYVSGLIGDIWALLNPWAAMFDYVDRLVRRIRPEQGASLKLTWPDWLGDAPALLLLLWFVWAELIWPDSDVPTRLASAVLTYSLITWLGMFLFGKQAWLRHGEAFSVLFSLLARFAPTEYRVVCPASDGHDERQLNLRPWAVGLLTDRPLEISRTVFVVVMLAGVTFDGLLATPLWATIGQAMLVSETIRPAILLLQDITGDAIAAIGTIAMFVFLLSFQLVYLLFSALVWRVLPARIRAETSIRAIAGLFVLTLIPISLAYHLAHYLSYLLIVGQYMIPLISDPFGFGWDLFGTGHYMVNIGIVNARFVWQTSVVAIVVGHIIAVYLSHVTALRVFADKRVALISQVPMLFLMVGYTMISLWILAQPVVELG